VANTVSGFYQTLVVAATSASRALVGTTALLDQVYRDFKPVAVSPGQTLNIPIPQSVTSQVSDIGVGDFTPVDVTANTKSLVFNQHPGFSYIIRDFEQFNTPESIRAVFLDAAIKGMAEYINAAIAALFTPTNFSSYAVITSGTQGTIALADMTKAWGNLAAGKIPVRDLGNFFLTTHPTPYSSLLSNTSWTANSQVGYQLAGQIRRAAMLGEQFGAATEFDQQMPANVQTAVTGTNVGVTSASAAVTGTGTAFTTQLVVGDWLQFASDATGTYYQVLSITDDTHLTLTANFVGSTGSTTAKFTRYTNALFHRNAIALGLRLLPPPDPRIVDATTVYYKGIPISVQFGFNQLKRGWVVTLDAGYALGVIRGDHAQLIRC
jgi:hypothetical protein